MYHDIVPGDPGGGSGPERFSVSLAAFEQMLDAIIEGGYVGCSLQAALEQHERSRVAITFDDGTSGQFDHAAPALRARDMTATFFVTTDWVGTEGFMTWQQLRKLDDWGMSVQSHTMSHPHLSELDHTELRFELMESKAMLDSQLGQNTTQIALPGGNAPSRALRHVLSETGYRVVATSRWGRNRDLAITGSGEICWIRRCNAPRAPTPQLAARILAEDRRLAVARSSREAALNGLRALLGASRYARWRRCVLKALERR